MADRIDNLPIIRITDTRDVEYMEMDLENGVVPQTAELAWKSLWRKINEDNNH